MNSFFSTVRSRFMRLALPLAFTPGWMGHAADAASPRSPDDERAGFVLADSELRIDLVAAEPAITSPNALSWDATGRLYVAEMNDYPTAAEGGRIRLLEDRDGDGRYETSHVFAEGLHYPASVLAWRDGVLVAAAPDVLFLRDTDGDGRADERRVLLSGFHPGNQQLRVNSLTWGLDTWIYGANGRSDGELRGGALTAPLSLRRRDFRFDPDSGRVEALAGASQFGLGFTATGERFLSWNTIPLRHEVIPVRYLDAWPALADLDPLQDILERTDDHREFPIGPTPPTFNRESTTHFNALSGLHIYGGDAMGAAYVGNAFMGESIRGLIHRRVLSRDGATFVARRAENEKTREFLASTDPWSHFVNFATGPDGALYVCDFYRRWVEHPGFVPPKFRDAYDWREGWQHGRVWRIARRDRPPGMATPAFPSQSDVPELVARLQHPNAWQRTTAQRLLVERGTHSEHTAEVRASLQNALLHPRDSSTASAGRLVMLYALERLGGAPESALLDAWRDSDPDLRTGVLRLLAERAPHTTNSSPALERALARGLRDRAPSVRLHALLWSTRLPLERRLGRIAESLRQGPDDPWVDQAALIAAAEAPGAVAAELLRSRGFTNLHLLHRLGTLVPASAEATVEAALTGAARGTMPQRLAWLTGFTQRPARSSMPAAPRLADLGPATRATLAAVTPLLDDPKASVEIRRLALRLSLATANPSAVPEFSRFLRPGAPAELQSFTADLLAERADQGLAKRLLEEATTYASPARRRLLGRLASTKSTAPVVLEALESRHLAAAEMDTVAREAWRRQLPTELQPRANRQLQSLEAGNTFDRATVVTRYETTASGGGDARRGAAHFEQLCAVCHRVGTRGGNVGPDLSGIGSRAPETLLVDILDPSRTLAADYTAYTVHLRDHEELTGLITAETPGAVVVRRPNLPDTTVTRDRIQELEATARSLMPDGFEGSLTPDAMRDLLAFLAAPKESLLPTSPVSR